MNLPQSILDNLVEDVLTLGDVFFMVDKGIVKARNGFDFGSIWREFLAEIGKRRRVV